MKKNLLTVGRFIAISCVILAICATAQAAPYAEDRYFSLYQQVQNISYVDANGAQKTQTRVGYRYQNDLTDSIIVCGKENDSCAVRIQNMRRTLSAGYSGQTILFKVFVPPGSSAVSLITYVGQGPDLKYFTVARLGSPPQVENTYTPNTSNGEFNSLPYLGFTLSQLRAKDCIGKHSSGLLTIVDDSGPNIVTEPDGAWLYVIVKVISGDIISNVYVNDINVGNPDTPGTYLGWYAQKTLNNTWGTLNEQSYINAPTGTPTPTPTPTPTATPNPNATPTPTPTAIPGSGCDMYTCPNGHCVDGACVSYTLPTPTPTSGCDALICYLSGGTCVNGVCVKPGATPTPTPVPGATPTPTPTSGSGCDALTCYLSGGSCVNGACVKPNATPTPTATPGAGCDMYTCPNGHCVNGVCVNPTPTPTTTPTPTPTTTPTPTPTPSSLSFTAKPWSQVVVQKINCSNIDMNNLEVVLTANPPPAGNVTCYSAMLIPDSTPYLVFAQKDILGNTPFLRYIEGDPVKGFFTGTVSGTWNNGTFQYLFSQISGITCDQIADIGLNFYFGYAPDGDLSKLQGAAFTFTKP